MTVVQVIKKILIGIFGVPLSIMVIGSLVMMVLELYKLAGSITHLLIFRIPLTVGFTLAVPAVLYGISLFIIWLLED